MAKTYLITRENKKIIRATVMENYVDYYEPYGIEGRIICQTKAEIEEVLRDLAEGGKIEELVETVHDYVRELDSFTYTSLGNWEAYDEDIHFFEWGGDVSVIKGNEELAVVGEYTPIADVWSMFREGR